MQSWELQLILKSKTNRVSLVFGSILTSSRLSIPLSQIQSTGNSRPNEHSVSPVNHNDNR